MTPKEKAKELFDKFSSDVDLPIMCNYATMGRNAAKQCALIAVEEIISILLWNGTFLIGLSYWQEVKQEIEKL